MKFILSLFVVCAVLATKVKAVSRDEQHKMMLVMGKSCLEKEGGSESDFNELLNHALPTTKPGKCLRACMMESIGLIVDGKPSLENAVQIAKLASEGDEAMVSLTSDIYTECHESVIDPDRCEMAGKILGCILAGLNKRNIDPKKYFV